VSEDLQPELTKLEGNSEYEAAIDTLLARSGRKLRIFERQLGKGYNSSHRHDLLRHFLLAGRGHCIQIVLHDATTLQRDCPRMVLLLRQFSHVVGIHETEPQARGVYDPFSVIDERDYVHRFHYDGARGLLGLNDPQGALVFVQRFEEIWAASTPAASATTLGL
jgi:hypothetical protein